jgi:hypothetical protein
MKETIKYDSFLVKITSLLLTSFLFIFVGPSPYTCLYLLQKSSGRNHNVDLDGFRSQLTYKEDK